MFACRGPLVLGFDILQILPCCLVCYLIAQRPEDQQLNKDISKAIYYHALRASTELAEKEGTYETYNGSPVSKVSEYFKRVLLPEGMGKRMGVNCGAIVEGGGGEPVTMMVYTVGHVSGAHHCFGILQKVPLERGYS
ncbi:hypothetical protein L1987_05982 [Smallanthus sonchifolius]|uniref:Uncharacterized protein n=1 Tax=Smallanthus sonchifolius TaxID=185202 RepID=A0ACB9JX12_9ASTR|nr:hypothetical protein L1987_05982 [Smallanthus sonchifolius]